MCSVVTLNMIEAQTSIEGRALRASTCQVEKQSVCRLKRNSWWTRDLALTLISFSLLVSSTAAAEPIGFIVKAAWLASFAALTIANVGSAFALYIGVLAIYSPLHFDSWLTFSDRPDNFAAAVLLTRLIADFSKRRAGVHYGRWILLFLVFTSVHCAMLAPGRTSALMRSIIIPFLTFELIANSQLTNRHLSGLQLGMAVVGLYAGTVSVLERTSAVMFLLPPWIGNASLRPADEFLDGWIGSGRSGGILLQPAWNGLSLSLICCVLLLPLRSVPSWLKMASGTACVAGAFFTYTRGVWLGLFIGLLWFPGWCRTKSKALTRRAILIAAAAGVILAAGTMASDRIHDEVTIYYRLNIWGAGLRVAQSNPLFGVGFFKFREVMTTAEQGFGASLPGAPDVEGDASHNTLLTVLVEFGAVGLILCAFAFYQTVRRARCNMRLLAGHSGGAWVTAFVLVYLVNAQFVSSFEGTPNTAFLGVLGALAGARHPLGEHAS